MSWLPASELMNRFQVWGRFYQSCIAGVPEQLRSHLELFPSGWEPHRAIGEPADLVVVMMNPGSSKPLLGGRAFRDFVPTRPDNTQYQILRLILRARESGRPWQHARVINLSDLRTPKSAELVAKLRLYEADSRHSIFCDERKTELAMALGRAETPVLRAWGLHKALYPLAQMAHCRLAGHPELGLCEGGTAYRHPLPQRVDLQRAWLDRVSEQACVQVVGPAPMSS